MSTAILVASFVLGAPVPTGTESPDPQVRELVKQLGSRSFKAREEAALKLLKLGSGSVAALSEGIEHEDPEVSERCKQLLPQAAALERDQKLAELLRDPSAPPPKGLPSLERFLKITGDDKPSRELYAELLAIHHRTLEAMEEDPRKGAAIFGEYCNDAYNKWQAGIRNGRFSYDNIFSGRVDIAYFLFLSSDARMRKNGPEFSRSYIMLNGNQVSNAIKEETGSQPMRKLFLDWLENETLYNLQQRGFTIAADLGLKEALPLALRILERKENNSMNKAQVMIALLRLGSKDLIPKLEPLMQDKTVITTVNFGNGNPLTVQTRDVAMGVAVQLTGQKLVDFGFDNRFGGAMGTSYIYYGFPDDKARDEAHAKWKEWTEKNAKK